MCELFSAGVLLFREKVVFNCEPVFYIVFIKFGMLPINQNISITFVF